MALEITDENINELLSKKSISVIDFYAEWCAPCKMLGPVIDDLATEMSDVTIGKLNVSDNAQASSQYQITGIPCIVFFKDGVEVSRVKGVTSKSALKKIIEGMK